MYSLNESSHHPQTRVKCPHVSISDESHSVRGVVLFDVERCHVKELQGVKYSTP
jgi:pterin-4a-carbinolamine dehydratase